MLFNWFREIWQAAESTYGVSPLVFLIIYIIATPTYYLGIYLIGKHAYNYKKKCKKQKSKLRFAELLRQRGVLKGYIMNRASWGAPYVYVVLNGKSLPQRFYLLLTAWVVVSFYLFFNTMRRKYI